MNATGDDQYYAYKIRQIEEQEQRIGKVGKNKVGKEYADKQKKAVDEKREAIIKEIEQAYFDGDPDGANKASSKYDELRDKPVEFIDSYKKTNRFVEDQAESIILERLKEQRANQPKFTKKLTQEVLDQRNELINNTELNNGYKFDTTNYNDRYIKEEN